MVTGSEKNKRQIFNLITFWVIAGFTLISEVDVHSPDGVGLFSLNFVTRGLALWVIYSIASPSNRTPLGAMLLTGLAWMTTHIIYAGFGDVDGPFLVLAVASTTTLVVNSFYEFDVASAWRAPRWAGAALLLVAGLVAFEAWEATLEPDPCPAGCSRVHLADCYSVAHESLVKPSEEIVF